MFRSFEEIEAFVLRNRRARMRIALAAAQDGPALSALVEAKRKGVARGVLIGKEDEIRSLLAELGEKAEDYRILDCQEDAACAGLAARLIHSGEADVMMKGILPTATFVRAILNHENGLVPPGGLISQAAVFPCPGEERLVVFTDCAVNIAPDLAAKRRILENVLPVTAALGMERPKVAVLSAVICSEWTGLYWAVMARWDRSISTAPLSLRTTLPSTMSNSSAEQPSISAA